MRHCFNCYQVSEYTRSLDLKRKIPQFQKPTLQNVTMVFQAPSLFRMSQADKIRVGLIYKCCRAALSVLLELRSMLTS